MGKEKKEEITRESAGVEKESAKEKIAKESSAGDASAEKSDKTICEEELEKCKEELASFEDRYLRAHADFENMKKRLEKDKAMAVAFANESFAEDLLSIIDSFESALVSMDQMEEDDISHDAVSKIKEGVTLTYEQMLKVLKKHGVEEIANEGVFDPYVHQVVQQLDSDEHESGEIVQVLQKGYKLRDRVLRPSVVCTKK